VVSVFSALLGLDVSKERLDDSMSLSRSYNKLETALDEIPASAARVPVLNQIDELLSIINDYQDRIFASEGMTEQKWIEDPFSFPRPEKTSIANKALFIAGKNPTYDTRLQDGLGDLVSELQKSATSEEIAGKIPLIFDFCETPGDRLGWTQAMFVVTPRSWSLIYLDGLETNLKILKAGY
jgi:Fe-S oxidoreductase